MNWLKEHFNWYVVLGLLVVFTCFGIIWMMSENGIMMDGNGSLKAWAAKPFSQATMGDIALMVIVGALLVKKS